MTKERLSRLQRWILLQCYKRGKDHYATPSYWLNRHYLVYYSVKGYLKQDKVKKRVQELQKGFGRIYNEEQQYRLYKYRFEISITGSLRNLWRKGLVELFDKDRIWLSKRKDYGYRQVAVYMQLTDKGVKLIEGKS